MNHLTLAEHMHLLSTLQVTVVIFASCLVTLLIVGAILAERWDDDGNY